MRERWSIRWVGPLIQLLYRPIQSTMVENDKTGQWKK
jgi:hypothetical protein